jgi:hypothetical protein
VVNASDLPLSILIVGVGSADFTSMEVYLLTYIIVCMFAIMVNLSKS